jgi:hypothetical protein
MKPDSTTTLIMTTGMSDGDASLMLAHQHGLYASSSNGSFFIIFLVVFLLISRRRDED